MDRLVYSIWLSLSCTPDTATFGKLIDRFDDVMDIYSATEKELRSAVGPNNSDCKRLINKDLTLAKDIYDFCTSKGVGIVTYYDDNFPPQLKDIPTPPVLLYYRGTLPYFHSGFRCAVVGARHISDYGRRNAFKMGYDLGSVGAVVVSGMAMGIDGVALAGAIAAGGQTIAVIGSGIDVCYPPEHQRLAREIVKNGCVFTEYAPGTKPLRHNFPRRNRIISGLSSATVVIEGREGSGSVITAKHAKSQGRAVYALPGNVGNITSEATNMLIKNGAKLCTSADDIVRDFGEGFGTAINPFLLKDRLPVNMMSVLSELRVSAVAPNDDIFKASRGVGRVLPKEKTADFGNTKQANVVHKSISYPEVDEATLRIYNKIPVDKDCLIEALVDSNDKLRDVMKGLLRLEMGGYVVILPGERVKRIFD